MLSEGNNLGNSSGLMPGMPISANPARTLAIPVTRLEGDPKLVLLAPEGEEVYVRMASMVLNLSYFSRDPL